MNEKMIFDRASTGMGAMERMKLMRELKDTRKDVSILGAGAMAAMQRLKLMAKVKGIRAKLGVKTAEAPKIEPVIAENLQNSVENIR